MLHRLLPLLLELDLLRERLAGLLVGRLLLERLLCVRRLPRLRCRLACGVPLRLRQWLILGLILGPALGSGVLRELLRRRSVATRLAGVRVLRGLGRGCGHGRFLKDDDGTRRTTAPYSPLWSNRGPGVQL